MIIGIVVIVTIVFIQFSHTETSSLQREKIHSFDPSQRVSLITPLRMQDMEPNSAVYFMYPPNLSSFGDENHFQKFILIRLPLIFNEGKNDIASFRAYSAVDLASHCLLKYWPNEGRQIEDPCISPAYRAIDGISEYWPNTNLLRVPSTGALPRLDLSTDESGFIYVEPPVFTEDRNGVVGVGRKITRAEFDQGTILEKTMHSRLNEKMNSFYFPEMLSTGHKLKTVDYHGSVKYAQYRVSEKYENIISIAIEYCNCSKTYREILETEGKDIYGDFWRVGDTDIYGVPAKVDVTRDIYSAYSLKFYKDGFKVSLFSDLSFDDSMKLVLENYFPGFTLDDVKRIETT